MRITKMLGVALLFLAWVIIYPVSQAYAYFAEDSFTPFWEQSVQSQAPASSSRPAKAGARQYVVNQGDTVWGISRNTGIAVDKIMLDNNLAGDAMLQPGQVLALPAATLGLTHRAAPGETLWSLARRYHVDLARLMSCNKISDPACLSVGQVLVIPGRTARQAGTQQPGAVRAAARGWDNSLGWPLLGVMTQQFGPLDNGEHHHGLDIAANTGTTVRAAQRGTVLSCGWLPFYGFTVLIDHGSGFRTLYGHLHESLVKKGDLVEKGQVIAHVGSTGRATGPHLHFELRKNNQAINPLPYLGN